MRLPGIILLMLSFGMYAELVQAELPDISQLVFTETTTGNVEKLIGEEIPPPPEALSSVEEFRKAFGNRVLTAFFDRTESPDVQQRLNVVYAEYPDKKLRVDIYSPKTIEKPAPAILMIHGGGWAFGSRRDCSRYAKHFAELGYVAVCVEYRLSPQYVFPAAIHDCKAAVRWMRANADELQIDTNRIAAMGQSAGAHLALLLGYAPDHPELEGTSGNNEYSSDVQAVISLYAPSVLHVLPPPEGSIGEKILKNFLGATIKENPDLYRLASPYDHLTENAPPTLLIHGTGDEVVPVQMSDLLALQLKSKRIQYVYDRVPNWPHSMDFAPALFDRTIWMTERFLQNTISQKSVMEVSTP